MELFNIWTVVVVAIALHYWFENKKLEKTKKVEELEGRIIELEKCKCKEKIESEK